MRIQEEPTTGSSSTRPPRGAADAPRPIPAIDTIIDVEVGD
jgi:hypothetical protein